MQARRDGISLLLGFALVSLLPRSPRLSSFSSGPQTFCSVATGHARGGSIQDTIPRGNRISSAGSAAVAWCARCFLGDVGSPPPLPFLVWARSLIVSFWVWVAASRRLGVLCPEWADLSGALPQSSVQQIEPSSRWPRLLRVTGLDRLNGILGCALPSMSNVGLQPNLRLKCVHVMGL